jgi:DNA topoisomerase-3
VLAQALYEKKAITYPRTDCAYLPEDMLPKLLAHLKAVRQEPYLKMVDEAERNGIPRGKRVINTITAHHAIIPTTEKIRLEKLSEPELKLYDLIVRRFLAVWYPAANYLQTEIVTEVEQELFRTKGRILLSPGWKKVYSSEDQEDKKKRSGDLKEDENGELPPVENGKEVQTGKVKIEEKSTKPPKRFTQGDLLKAMEGAGKQIEDDVLRQQMKGKGLGTVATRPAIIESLIERGYIRQEQKTLKPTEKGLELIFLIKSKLAQAQLLISPEMTGQLEYDLAKVEKGELSLEKYMTQVEKAVTRIINELRTYEQRHGKTPLALAPEGKVKRVGTKKTGTAKIKATTKEGTGKEGVGEINRKKISEKAHDKNQDKLGLCPRCDGEIIEGKKGYGCSNWKKGCKFVVWKNPICGKVLTPTQLKSLLKKGKTPLIKGFKSKNGNSFSAYLVWEDKINGKLNIQFDNS